MEHDDVHVSRGGDEVVLEGAGAYSCPVRFSFILYLRVVVLIELWCRAVPVNMATFGAYEVVVSLMK